MRRQIQAAGPSGQLRHACSLRRGGRVNRYASRMARLRPGWFVVLCATVLLVSAWLPWVTTVADGGGRATGVGGRYGQIGVPPDGFGVGQLFVLLSSTL